MNEASLSLVRAKSLTDQVADSIVEGIAKGILVPGQKVIEVELANRLQVSRVPVREALKILEAQGIVESRPHRGMRVVPFDKTRIAQIYEARLCLEKIALRDAYTNTANRDGLLGRLDDVIGQMELSLERGDLQGVTKADMAFHREICRASENDIVLILWETLSRHMTIIFMQELEADRDRIHIVDHHRALRQILESGTLEELLAALESHILRIQGRLALG